MNDLIAILIFVGIWYLLMGVILPKLGISTCMSGACRTKCESTECKPEQRKKSDISDKA